MDEDLERMSRHELLAHAQRLRAGIRDHRDSTRHGLCWHHPQLWGLLPEKVDPAIEVPAWPQFMRGCIHYRESLDAQKPHAPRVEVEFESTAWKPDDYPSLSPYVLVDDAEGTIEFLEKVFGARRLRMVPADAPGKWRHAELRIDDGVFMIADTIPGYPARPAHLHLYVENVDEVHARALSLGARSVQEPVRKGDEDKRGGFEGPGGITWWVATQGASGASG